MEFVCDNCGVFLNSVDGAVAVCKCDGQFHAPPAEAPEVEGGTEGSAETIVEPETDFNDPVCKKCAFVTRAMQANVQAAMLRHYAGHDPNAE